MITKEEIRAKRNAPPFVPFIIHRSDGAPVRVKHPQSILAASKAPRVVVLDRGELYYILVNAITGLEEAPPQEAAR